MKPGNSRIWKQVQQELAVWRVGALPGVMVIGLIVFLRLLGLLQSSEWSALDYLLRLRPDEATDERILIVGIHEKDISTIGTYPVPDAVLAQFIEKLQTHQPRAIGLDIFRDLPVEPGHQQLIQQFQTSPNLIGIEKTLPDATGKTIPPPPGLPDAQAGFADLIADGDAAIRRALIGVPAGEGYQFSLPLLLAEQYLAKEGLFLENGIRDKDAMRFGNAEFDRFRANSGGYVRADAAGNQFLINYRSGTAPFRVVSLTDIVQGNVPNEWIRDRLVLIGMMATSAGDARRTTAVDNSQNGWIYGVEVHAHITSQMLSTVLDGRPWLRTWAEGWEYAWIIGWGILGISLGRLFVAPFKILLGLGVASLLLVGSSFYALTLGWWLPIVPALLVLVFNGAGLTASLFYRYQQDLQARLHDRQLVIDKTYTAIHNNPVQTVKSILRSVREGNITTNALCADLERLEQELRAIEESVRQETLLQSENLYLTGGIKLNLEHPIQQLLHEVYRATLARTRDFPLFKSVIKIVSFEEIENRRLTIQQKQGLCRFIEEALCNAGKYAEGMTRLEVSCKTQNGWNIIRVADNGMGMQEAASRKAGYGTKQAVNLARQLGGTFSRISNKPKGIICELAYPVRQPWFWFFGRAK
ncbi:CHASE2 domain-containing protein [Cyanobacteria bacterium FACHB-502]|nr:CHASE2 domain-containing protein [Cyanobacteria bacterium FACHB-502]